MATRLSISRYIGSFFIDQEPTVNNQTIDDQLAGSLINIRPCVSRCIQNPNAIMFAEKGFRASHDLYLECILRQSRSVSTNDEFTWDTTSKLNGVAPGRQLAADALFYMRHAGIQTETGQAVFNAAKLKFGVAASYLFPRSSPVQDIVSPGGPVLSRIETNSGILIWAEYVDKKRQRDRFSGDCDFSTLRVEEDWE